MREAAKALGSDSQEAGPGVTQAVIRNRRGTAACKNQAQELHGLRQTGR